MVAVELCLAGRKMDEFDSRELRGVAARGSALIFGDMLEIVVSLVYYGGRTLPKRSMYGSAGVLVETGLAGLLYRRGALTVVGFLRR